MGSKGRGSVWNMLVLRGLLGTKVPMLIGTWIYEPGIQGLQTWVINIKS